MNKLLVVFAALLTIVSFALARHAADDLPQRLNADGHLLRFRVEGNGSPTVVLEIGLGGALEEWAAVQAEVAGFTRIVAYDRIGARHRQESLSGRAIAIELHTALANANISPPYVLVGQSFGGVYNRVFASMYPDEVAGMVLLDPTQEKFIDWMKAHHPKEEFTNQVHKNWPEANGVSATLEELAISGPLPNVPVIVVTAARPNSDRLSKELLPAWIAAHDDWVKTLPQGRHVVTEKSGHGIHIEQSDLVVDLIRESVERARRTNPGPAGVMNPAPANAPDAGSETSRCAVKS